MTGLPPDQRNIAQVFQFPVIYDTMTVYDNLAFPAAQPGWPARVDRRVIEIAEMLDVTEMLRTARGASVARQQAEDLHGPRPCAR